MNDRKQWKKFLGEYELGIQQEKAKDRETSGTDTVLIEALRQLYFFVDFDAFRKNPKDCIAEYNFKENHLLLLLFDNAWIFWNCLESHNEYILLSKAIDTLQMWLDQYYIKGDKEREGRPEIIASLALIEQLKASMED